MIDIDLSKLEAAEGELKGESDRAAAIVGASIIESQLEDLLTKAMIPDAQTAPLFDGYGPLSTLSAKISIIESFGFLPKDICKDLHLLRKIRNEFAHQHGGLSFDSPKISAWVSTFGCLGIMRGQLQEYKTDPESWSVVQERGWNKPRRQFDITVSWLSIHIASRLKSLTSAQPLPDEYSQWKKET